MKTMVFSLLITVFFSLSAQAQVNCDSAAQFCMDEFVTIGDSAPTIVDAIKALPTHVKNNLTFKRGNNIEKRLNNVGILGPHGHLVSKLNSGSASPQQPRVIVWDEQTGFTASWNSGNSAHTAHDRMDLYDFNFDNNTHRLMAWNPSHGFSDANAPDKSGRRCTDCHGQVQRPIFPMYPDWPQFYGEFNDEMAGYPSGHNAIRADLRVMANQFQPVERALYTDFVSNEGRTNERYSVLFDARTSSGGNPYYPFRPATTTTPFSNVSRAFHHRPNLRLGVVYNRLVALQAFEKIKKSPLFKKFPDVMFYAMLDCNWNTQEGKGPAERNRILGKVLAEAKNQGLTDLNLRGVRFDPNDLTKDEREDTRRFHRVSENGATYYYASPSFSDTTYRQIPYEDLLQMLGLKIEDIDIRFRHDAKFKATKINANGDTVNFEIYNPKAFYNTNSAMDIGYVKNAYPMNPICDNSNSTCRFNYNRTYMSGMKYFNSYFDGSATTNELLAARMLNYLTDANQDFSNEPDLNNVRTHLRGLIPKPNIYYETLMKKYRRFTARLRLDREFFNKVDGMSPWIQLPYSPDLLNVHNRESYWRGNRNCTRGVCLRHAQWATLADRASGDIKRRNKNGGENICWNVHASMFRRYK